MEYDGQYASLPLHLKLQRSVSHSPFPMHVDVSGPVSTSPGGQEKVMFVPCIAGSPKPMIVINVD